MSKRNRQAGHNLERRIAEQLREIGFVHAVTSRSESRSRDDQKVDIINKNEAVNGRLPYNVQAKNSVKSLKYPKILAEMPTVDNVVNLIVHRQTVKKGERFMFEGDYAILKWQDLLNIIEKLKKHESANVGRKLVQNTPGGDSKTILSEH